MNVDQPFAKLLEPSKIGQMTVKNRMVMLPMVTNFASEEGYDLHPKRSPVIMLDWKQVKPMGLSYKVVQLLGVGQTSCPTFPDFA